MDGDGLETVGLSANIYFDHDGDGVLTRTGWAGKDDALLVWDRNANGSIDTGAELFGDFTPLPNGTLAPNGFAALAALDSNGDGILDATDPAFAELRLWRDADQNGVTGAGELISLLDAGILSLNLANTLKNKNLANGNQLTREGSFTRTDGTTSAMGEFKLAIDTFNTRFAEQIEVPEALKTLSNMQGAGNVRELQQAAAQSGDVANLLAQFQSATTRAEQRILLDQLITTWADTAGMAGSLEERVADKYRIEYEAFGNERRSSNLKTTASSGIGNATALLSDADSPYLSEPYRALIAEWSRKLHVLEAFNGQYFFNLPSQKSQTTSASVGLSVVAGSKKPGATAIEALPTLRVNFSQAQLDLLQQAYDSLSESLYASLVLQTRLKPYLDQIELVIDDNGIRLDATALNQMLADKRALDPENALADLFDLDKYAGGFLTGTNWNGILAFDSLIETLPNTPAIQALLDEFKVRRLGAGDDNTQLANKANFVLAGDGNDVLRGNNGNDRLFGQGGNDAIHGGNGDDLISGGAGNDMLYGGAGADTYVFGRGYGHDTIIDDAEDGLQRDTVRLLGLNPADIQVTVDYDDNLVFTIVDTAETLSVPRNGYRWGPNGVGQYVFDDGTVWSHDDALRMAVAASTEGDDVIHGSAAGDTITGQAGNDTLIGNGGDDLIDGGAGNDVLIGASGWDYIYEDGQYRGVRNVTPRVTANGNDTYLFGRGDGQDTVIDGDHTLGNSDTLRFKAGVAPADVKLIRNGNDLVLAIRDSSDQVTLKQYFDEDWNGANGPYLIERIAFADGTVLSFADVQAMLFAGSEAAETIIGSRVADVLTGQGGDDVLLGGAGNDILDGGAGNDVLRGGGMMDASGWIYDNDGAGDTYRFGRGDGHDLIIENSWGQDETDRIEFKAGVAPADVRLERVRIVNGRQVSDDLRITIRDTGETLTIQNHFNESNRYAVEEIVFADGTLWDAEMIRSLSLLGEAGNDELRGFNGRDDVLAGGAGNDTLAGGSGSDTYRFGLGDGLDMIDEGYTAGEDTVALGAGVTPADVTVRWTMQGDMAITLSDGSRLTVRGQTATWSLERGIEQLRFADGTVWDRTALSARALAATDGDDVIVGSYEDDTLDGGAGNDHFQNLGGDDTYLFGVGDGQDVIEPTYGRVLFKPGIGQNDVNFTRDGKDLIATVATSGDAVRIKAWFNNYSWQRIDRFDFDNGASLDESDVFAKLGVSEDQEVLYGSPGDDVLIGTEKDSTLHGREGNDTLVGGAGSDWLFGEAGDDTLDGGADRDWLSGGEGNNTYIVAPGMGLDIAVGASLAVASDTVVFAPGIRPTDISVQLGEAYWIEQAGELGYYDLVIGIGGNDALIVCPDDWTDLSRGAIQHFRFDDGTEWTLADVIARADGGIMGWQEYYEGEETTLLGSQADDEIYDYSGQSLTVQARGNNDRIHLATGNNRVSAGSGDDNVDLGAGDDLLAGEAGNDELSTGEGDDVVVFNYGDGNDTLRTEEGTDTLSFGATVTPALLSAALNRDGRVVLLVDMGAGGSITLDGTRIDDLPGDLERIQFIDEDGRTRVFDLAGWLKANSGALLSATTAAPLAFDGTGFELTRSVAPAGGLEAVAYAQSGDLFAAAHLANNTPTDGDDLLYGTNAGEALDAGAGDDIVLGLAGDDTIAGGDGNDLIHGGAGDDVLDGGAGNDTIYGGWGTDVLAGGTGHDALYGEWGGDTYLYQAGDGVTIIDDDHRMLTWERDIGPWFFRGTLDYNVLNGAPGDGDDGDDGDDGIFVDDAPNILSFGPGIRPQDLRYSERDGDLVIEFANQPGDRVILRGYVPGRATQTRSVDIIRFADGTEIAADSIELTGMTATIGDEGGWLYGTPFADTLIGGDGDDMIYGEGGSDFLAGGAGSDTYNIYKEWGSGPAQTTIVETWRAQDDNRIELTGQIDADALHLAFDGRDLLLCLNEDGDLIRFAGFDPRAPGMQAPVSEISLPWEDITLSFDDLMARGVRIIGTPNDDVLTGTAFVDWIEGREANDAMSGGAGGDLYRIDADGGTDTIIDSENGDAPNMLLLPEGTTLDDVRLSFDQDGFLILDLDNTGNRVRLSGFDPQNPLGPRAVDRFYFGITGDEIGYEELLARGFDIVGTNERDVLKGTTLTDRIRGGNGNDLIEATPGGDWLAGEGGNDTYVVKLGDGIVTIDDLAEQNAGNVLRFGPGIDPNAMRNNLRFEADGNGGHVLLIPYGDAGDVVRLTGFDPRDVLGNHAIEHFEFADGTVVDYATLVSWTFVVEGDNAGNVLAGTNVGDRLYGYDGDDVMESGDGEDVLTGGLGNDVLRGGAQRDAYVVNLGDGEDVIEDDLDAGIGNMLTFGAGIAREDVQVALDGDDLLVRYGADGDMVRVRNYAPDGASAGTVIDTFEFADGTAVTLREFMNRAPEVANPIDDQVALEDAAFSLRLPDDLFIDANGDDILTRVTVSGYETQPDWLQYEAATRTLFGTPDNDDVGEFDVIVQGMDTLGASSLHSFHVTVQNTNDTPETGTLIAAQQATEDTPFAFTVPQDAFHDVDAGDVLTLSATQADGLALPSWLQFDAAMRSFSGTPANGDVGSVSVRLTAADVAGAQASQTFAIGVANVNDAPEVGTPLANQSGRAGTALSWQLPGTAFVDVDAGDVLAYSATLSDGSTLPGWLAFDAATGTFSGTPSSAGNHVLRVTATDLAGAQASQTFTLAVESGGGNQAPITTTDTASLIEDRKLLTWGNVLDNDRDPEGGHLHVADPGIRCGEYGLLTLLPNGAYAYVLDNFSAKVQGLGAGETLTETFGYLASDGSQRSNGALTVTVQGTNDAPELARCLADVQLARGKAFSWQMPAGSFKDADRNDTLSYTATLSNGKALPAWLKFDAATQTFSGTAPAITLGSIDVRITASDGQGAQSNASDVFKISFGSKTVVPAAAQGNESVDNGNVVDALLAGVGSLLGQLGQPNQPNLKQGSERDDDPLARFLDSFKRDDLSAQSIRSALPVLDPRWIEEWSGQWDEQTGHGQAIDDVAGQWAALTQALNRLDAERQDAPAWEHVNQGADLSGLAGWMQSSLQSTRGGIDAVSLSGGAGTLLKGLSGIKEGLSKLSW
ncbi:calcium-binding protein [Sterolibacterium denitrificans]|uniref:calcium-binding protein n=1 Tax=Sterolibacterium denitrificans TaxID=157592 RepID=UPI001561CC7F|nr:calcium-binding protein [Sterolibacterium denitrificans]